MYAHASQAFSTYNSSRDCTDLEHLPVDPTINRNHNHNLTTDPNPSLTAIPILHLRNVECVEW